MCGHVLEIIHYVCYWCGEPSRQRAKCKDRFCFDEDGNIPNRNHRAYTLLPSCRAQGEAAFYTQADVDEREIDDWNCLDCPPPPRRDDPLDKPNPSDDEYDPDLEIEERAQLGAAHRSEGLLTGRYTEDESPDERYSDETTDRLESSSDQQYFHVVWPGLAESWMPYEATHDNEGDDDGYLAEYEDDSMIDDQWSPRSRYQT